MKTTPERAFRTLDGIRGVAALSIVMLHAHRFFGTVLPSAHMAVDLFFVLSGFVLAHTYEPRFQQGLTPVQFLCKRYIRLYPMYLLGSGLGVLEALLAIRFQQGAIHWSWSRLIEAIPTAVLMLPNPFDSTLFPLNGIMWSIFFEFLANAIWAVCWRPLQRNKVLVTVVVISGLCFIASAFWWQTTGLGGGWNTFLGGLARVTYSFLLGTLLYRIHDSSKIPQLPAPLLLSLFPILAALRLRFEMQLLCALVLLPGLVLLASKTKPGAVTGIVCKKLGEALHTRCTHYTKGYTFLAMQPCFTSLASTPRHMPHGLD